MSTYRIELLPHTQAELESLAKPLAERILSRLEWLGASLDALQPKPLHGTLAGLYKLRVGNYRVVYSLDRAAQLISVHLIGRREDIYKRRL